MSLQILKDNLPEYAKDIKLNLSSILSDVDQSGGLTQVQIYGIALASALATRNHHLIQSMYAETGDVLGEDNVRAVKTATVIMAMNNVYYRFAHLASDKEFVKLPARLRMNILASHGTDKVSFELYALAVSAINACGMCIDAHVLTLQKHGLSNEAIQTSIRIAAVVQAVAQALEIEEAL